jgi:gamma-glutamyl-gamma-aminobutyrate hydrolase PuuD
MTTRRPPRIGLTSYRERAAWGVWDEPADLLPSSYGDAVAAAGGVPLLLPPTGNPGAEPDVVEAAAESVLDGLHGLVLSGGADIEPARYGATPDGGTGPVRPDRDAWELALVTAALRRDVPVLGVCRGMQLMAVALGGTLVQHLPDVVGNESHRPTVGAHARHDVRLAPGSRIAGLLGPHAQVATYHHQSVDHLPATAVATGWADDGTVEAFEVRDATWALGVQWHPEVHDGAVLFRAFVDASTDGER